MADNDEAEVIVAAVALVISVVALIATFMQVLQQYYASAAGYSQCNPKVMGEWAKTKTRRFLWDELRFEVQFHAPVIFVSPPDNKNGPVIGAPIFYLEGTRQSLEDTWTELEMDPRKEYSERSPKEKIHTADNERASWSILLWAIQRMESDSRKWQERQYSRLPPPGDNPARYGMPESPPSLRESHTLTVALQRKRKSWDTMPAAVVKPYATTTMCHLIEIMAALGIYWKEFDRKYDRYRAEGNGFMVLGGRVNDLGLMYSFQVYGKCTFGRNRVIPVDEVKELCFGYVPTIYRETLDQRRLEFPSDEPQNLSSLQMASRSEIAETLVLIGCNNNTVQYFIDEGKRTSHLFPVSFEILGMLSRTFYIENSAFTFIPNPTPDRWDKRSLSLVKIMEAYAELVNDELDGAPRNKIVLARIRHHIREILGQQPDPNGPKLQLLKALRHALDDTDEILTAKKRKTRHVAEPELGRPSLNQRDRSASSVLDGETKKQEGRREMVQDVLRSHIQQVLRLLNERDDRLENQLLQVPDGMPGSPASSRSHMPQLGFDDMDDASPDERQHLFMEVYFTRIRRTVVPRAAHSTTGRRTSHSAGPPGYGFRRAGTGRTTASIRDADVRSMPSLPPNVINPHGAVHGDSLPEPDSKAVQNAVLHAQEVSHDDIWCTLVFRMICWLMLHDFHKMDVQVNKSELLGSRMPVYIS